MNTKKKVKITKRGKATISLLLIIITIATMTMLPSAEPEIDKGNDFYYWNVQEGCYNAK